MTNEELIKRLQDFAAGTMLDEDAKLAFEAISALSRDRWISVEERLPETNKEVLVYLFGSAPYIVWMDEYGRWETNDFYVDHDYLPKMWMPLPEPPEEET